MSSFSARYTLRVPLGESALGSVWTALDRETQQQVAVLRLEEDAATETAKARFRDHAQRLLGIDHPNVVKALDLGDDDDGIPYLAVELLEGESLAARWASAPLRIDRFVELAVGVAEGLGALHAAGFSHGDVEPGNVFLVGAKGMETPKLIGIALNRVYARVGDDGEDRTSVATLHQLYAYAAPEQVKGEAVDSPSADLYSLAAVVYAGLSGSPPHVAPTVMALLESVTRKKAPTLAQVKRELSAFSATLDRALSAEPGRRFPDAASFARALKTCLVMGRAISTQEIPIGNRSPIGQPIAVGGSSAGTAVAAKGLARPVPKPGAAAAPRVAVAPATTAAAPHGGAAADATAAKKAIPARPLPRPGAKKTIQGLAIASLPVSAPVISPPVDAAPQSAAAGPIDSTAGEPEGRATEEIEIPLGSEMPPPPPPPPPPRTPTAALVERPSVELVDDESSEIALPVAGSPPPPPPARAAGADDAERPASPRSIEDAAIAPLGASSRAEARADATVAAAELGGEAVDVEAAAEPATDTEPAETKAAETKPAETKPAETKPAETKPADTAPAAIKASEIEPADTRPADTRPPAPKTPEPTAAPRVATKVEPPSSLEPVIAPLGSDDELPRARPAWIMPVAIAAIALLAVIGGVVAFGGGGEPTASTTEPPVVGASAPSETDPGASAPAPETAQAAEATRDEAATAEADTAAEETAADETAADETAAVDPAAEETAAADPAAEETAAEDTAEAGTTAEPDTAGAAGELAAAAATVEADEAAEPAVEAPRPRTSRRATTVRATRTAAPRATTARTRARRTAATRGASRGRPTVVSDPGF